MNRRDVQIPPVFYRTLSLRLPPWPLPCLPNRLTATIMTHQHRARVPLTISCIWATGYESSFSVRNTQSFCSRMEGCMPCAVLECAPCYWGSALRSFLPFAHLSAFGMSGFGLQAQVRDPTPIQKGIQPQQTVNPALPKMTSTSAQKIALFR